MIVGSDRIYAIENFYVKYLREAGVDVFHFAAQSYFYDYYQAGILNKLIFRAGLSGIHKKINGEFLDAVNYFIPDVVWVFKGMEIFPGSLQKVKAMGVKLVNFNGDSPFIFSGKGSGNKNVSESVGLYDLQLTYNSAVKKEIEHTYKMPVSILPFGYDIDDKLYETCCREKEILRVCFLGNPDEYRGAFLQQLAERGVPLALYGNNWKKFVQHPSVEIHAAVYADACWKVLRQYRVQLNLMRPHNPDTHNMRTFELGGVGAIQLAPSTADHQHYFKPEEELFIYKDLEDCVRQINKILSMDKAAADTIRVHARNRSLHSGYSYKARSLQALEAIKKLLG